MPLRGKLPQRVFQQVEQAGRRVYEAYEGESGSKQSEK